MKAIYGGTFDPLTRGHAHIISQASEMVDELVVSVGINPGKNAFFSLDDRLKMLSEYCSTFANTQVTHFENNFLVSYAAAIGADWIIRGLRNPNDFLYEQAMVETNKLINPKIKTIFIMADREYANVSSSLVKGLIGPVGWKKIVNQYIPPKINKSFYEALMNKI